MNEKKELSPEEEELQKAILEMGAFEIFHLLAQVSKWTNLGKKERALDVIEAAIRERYAVAVSSKGSRQTFINYKYYI